MTGVDVFKAVRSNLPSGWPLTNFLFNLNWMYRRVWTRYDWTWKLATGALTSVSSSGESQLPSTVAQILRAWYSSEGNRVPLTLVDHMTFLERQIDTNVGTPVCYSLSMRHATFPSMMWVYQRPETASTVSYLYVKAFTPLTAIGGTIAMPPAFLDPLVMRLTSEYRRKVPPGQKADWDQFRSDHGEWLTCLDTLVQEDHAGRDTKLTPSRLDGLDTTSYLDIDIGVDIEQP